MWRENEDDRGRYYYKDHNGVMQYSIPESPIEPSHYLPGMYKMSFDDTNYLGTIKHGVKFGTYAQLYRKGNGRLNFS
jgi:hypothetical protein